MLSKALVKDEKSSANFVVMFMGNEGKRLFVVVLRFGVGGFEK